MLCKVSIYIPELQGRKRRSREGKDVPEVPLSVSEAESGAHISGTPALGHSTQLAAIPRASLFTPALTLLMGPDIG